MADKISSFRLFLNKISNELITEELESLKFLCGDILTKAKLETIKNAKGLFVAIGEVTTGEEKQLNLLKQLFKNIDRLDLESQVEKFQESREGEIPDAGQHVEVAVDADNRVNDNRALDLPNYETEVPSIQPGNSVWIVDRTSSSPQAITEFLQPALQKLQVEPSRPRVLHSSDHTPNPNEKFKPPTELGSTPGNLVLQVEPSLQGHAASQQATDDLLPLTHQAMQVAPRPRVLHSSYHTPNPNEKFKPPTEQISAQKYHPQYSVPFGQQEQSSNKEDENIQWEEAQDPPQSSQSSLYFSIAGDSGDTNPGTSEDSGQHNGQENEAQNEVLNSRDNPDRGSSRTDGLSANTSSGQNLRISQSHAEKVPVERVLSNDYDAEAAQHLHQKCPVEMSYNCISKYFNSGGKKLGEGGFGIVYEGSRSFYGQNVVVKTENSSHPGQAYSAAQLKREKRVGYIKHPHLMPLYAFCEDEGKPRCLMYPKMHSDLHKALRRDLRGDEKLLWEDRVRIALHTARALLYLHTEVTNERNVRQEIIHMDVKPGNIFLDEDFNARLGDPGMAQELPMEYSYASISQIRGTPGYLDEYLQERHFKPVNDTFSFGVVLLQLLTQRKAVERVPPNRDVPLCHTLKKEGLLSDPERLMEKAKQGVWPDSGDDKNYTKEFAAITIDCLKPPDERAKLPDVCQRLEGILERRGVNKASKPKEGARCVSCLLKYPAKHMGARSRGCDGDINQECNYFCATCLTQARRNPLECPSHGPAEPPIGGSDVYAVLVCGNDPYSPQAAAVFQRDLIGFKSVLTDSRIVGVRNDHIFSITPSSSCGTSQATRVRHALQELQQKLLGKKDVFLYFYFSGHSDQSGNLLCSSEKDCLTEVELKEQFSHLNVNEFLIILDCCYADGKIASEHIEDEKFLVHKSLEPTAETAAEMASWQLPLESLCNNLQKTSGDGNSRISGKEPISNTAVDVTDTDFDTLDGNVFNKAPLVAFTIRQWSSSLSQQESYARAKGNSFLTQYIICGLRGAHECPFSNCSSCDTFKAQAKPLGYISAANLEDFISKHVEKAASRASGRHQSPRMRTVHSKETILAFYSEEILHDEILFRSTSGFTQRITIDKFPLLLLEFQKLVFSKVQGHLPICAQPKHLQILCDDEEIDATSFVDLQDLLRQGYDVRCQLRPCSSIVNDPVVVQIQNYKEQVITLLTSLQLTRNQLEDRDTFEMDTCQKTCTAEDVRECCEEQSSIYDLKDTSVGISIVVILTEASLYPGNLTICVLDDSIDCCFTKASN